MWGGEEEGAEVRREPSAEIHSRRRRARLGWMSSRKIQLFR